MIGQETTTLPRTAVLSAADRRPTQTDAWLVAALAAGSIVFAILYEGSGFWEFKSPLWVSCLLSLVVAVPLLWRRRLPNLVAWFIATVYVTAQILQMMEPGVTQIILFTSIYGIGAFRRSRRIAFISRTLLCIGIFVYVIVAAALQFRDLGDLTFVQFAAGTGVTFLINVVFFGGAWLFGDRAFAQRKLLVDLSTANAEVRSQEKQLTRQALDLERVRIARELHDGIAHHIAGVGIHAAAARRSIEKNPQKAKESLLTIESSTRQTVDELRSLVFTLRDPDEANAEGKTSHSTEGNPGLGDLPELIASAQDSGLSVEFDTIGQPQPLTPIMELSIYRVIQESLTNCSRYALTGAEVVVRLRFGAADLEVEVSDGRPPALPNDAPPRQTADSREFPESRHTGLGLGIVGMRERMSALGGSLEAGPKTRGGWLVSARLPYPHGSHPPDPADPNDSADSARPTPTVSESTAKAPR